MASHNYHKRRTKERKARQAEFKRLLGMKRWLKINAVSVGRVDKMSAERLQRMYEYSKAGRRY